IYRVEEIVKTIRNILPASIIIMGNLHANFYADEILKIKLADIVVMGEGEETLMDLMTVISQNKDLENVLGIKYRMKCGALRTNPMRPYISDLDNLPLPAWQYMNIKKYDFFAFGKVAKTGIMILHSRGCPYRCSFCSLIIQGEKRRARSINSVCDEMELMYDRYNFQSFHFIDPIFPINKQEGLNFCQQMIQRGLNKKITWVTETRTELVDKELLTAMKEANCSRIMYGIECGTQEVLTNIGKNNRINDAIKAVQLTRDSKITSVGLFMIGLPNETSKNINDTIEFSLKLKLDYAKFAVFVPYPGTAIYSKLVNESEDNGLDRKYLRAWNRYTSYPTENNPPLYLNPQIDSKKLIKLQKKAFLKFYFRPSMFLLHVFKLKTINFKVFIQVAIFLFIEIFSLIKMSANKFKERMSY
ncbi:MAG: radical SAM protein, partial [Oligoflexia bacterium]|nr:radical SAM protein [Oligoflexia bacterium]